MSIHRSNNVTLLRGRDSDKQVNNEGDMNRSKVIILTFHDHKGHFLSFHDQME